MNSMKNKREIYEAMSDFEADQLGNEIKWNTEFGTEQDSKNWQHVYNVCFNTIQDNTYIWFQYRIIQRILGTNHFLKKFKLQILTYDEYVVNRLKLWYIYFQNVKM